MRNRPKKNAMDKRNWRKIWHEVHQSAIKTLHDAHYAGGFVSLMDDIAMNNLADSFTMKVMENENIKISLKRS